MKFKKGDICIVKQDVGITKPFRGLKVRIDSYSYSRNSYEVTVLSKCFKYQDIGLSGWGLSEDQLILCKPKLKKFLEEFRKENES